MSSTLRSFLIILAVILVGLIVGAAITLFFLNARNAARPEAISALEPTPSLSIENVSGEDWLAFAPVDREPDTGLIIYPGGLVDPRAYAPLAAEIAAAGYLVILDPMPLNLAVIDASSAEEIVAAFPTVEAWAIGGHSLGGAMAADFAAANPQLVDGLALWAAYPAGGTDLSGLDLEVISVYGSADTVATVEEVVAGAPLLPPDTKFLPIEGGNHTQFGYYGEGLQRGDSPATVSRAEQQARIAAATIELLAAIRPSP